jgi:hypothetical protein
MKETPLIILISEKDLKRLFRENKNLKSKNNLIYFEEEEE